MYVIFFFYQNFRQLLHKYFVRYKILYGMITGRSDLVLKQPLRCQAPAVYKVIDGMPGYKTHQKVAIVGYPLFF